jgi:hypothetical protein
MLGAIHIHADVATAYPFFGAVAPNSTGFENFTSKDTLFSFSHTF